MHFFPMSVKCPATSKPPLLLLLLLLLLLFISYYNQLMHNYLMKVYITIVFCVTYSIDYGQYNRTNMMQYLL
jgi:hypothetical protein